MKQEYILLRESPSHSSSEFPLIELEELDDAGVSQIRKGRDFIALTPNIPVRLSEPVSCSEFESTVSQPGRGAWGIDKMGALECSLDGSGTVAAILDTGIDRAHPAFSGVSVVEEDFTGTGCGDQNGHGTHCAGILFGQDVSGIRIGVARGIDRALIGKVLDDSGKGESWDVVRSLCWAAENEANVISMSFRFGFTEYVERLLGQGYPPDLATSFALEAYRTTTGFYEKYIAFLRLRTKAAVVVAAAGNSNRRLENPAWESAVVPPASAGGVLSVGALMEGERGLVAAGFSNSGPNTVAPGVGILSAKANSGTLSTLTGTSMAAHHVAGVALLWAQLLSNQGELSSFNLEANITASADETYVSAGSRPVDIGKGVIQAPYTPDMEIPGGQYSADPQEEEPYYETKSMNLKSLLLYDSDPKMRQKRELLGVQRFAKNQK